MRQPFILLFTFLISSLHVFGQQGLLKGNIHDDLGNPVEFAIVAVPSLALSDESDATGFFNLAIPADTTLEIQVTRVNMKKQTFTVRLAPNEVFELDLVLKINMLDGVTILEIKDKTRPIVSTEEIKVKEAEAIPNPMGNFENLLQAQALGVTKNNELSSAYSVRGGNFDENLV